MINPKIERIFFALLFGAVFMIIGIYAPKIWLTYFDKTDYYRVQQPVETDKHEYKSCERLVINLVRTSSISDNAHSTVQLFSASNSGTLKFIPLFNGNIIVEKSNEQVFYLNYELPCNLPAGKYYIKAAIKYRIQGVDRNYFWSTRAFDVN